MADKTRGAYQCHEKHDIDRDERGHIGPEGETDWHGMYLDENRRAEKAERERDKLRAQVLAASKAAQNNSH